MLINTGQMRLILVKFKVLRDFLKLRLFVSDLRVRLNFIKVKDALFFSNLGLRIPKQDWQTR